MDDFVRTRIVVVTGPNIVPAPGAFDGRLGSPICSSTLCRPLEYVCLALGCTSEVVPIRTSTRANQATVHECHYCAEPIEQDNPN